MLKIQAAREQLNEKQDRVYGCKSAKHAEAILAHFGIDYELILVLRHGTKWDAVAGKPRTQIGVAGHYVNRANELVATHSQTIGALTIYTHPHKLGRMYLRDYNIRRKGHKWN